MKHDIVYNHINLKMFGFFFFIFIGTCSFLHITHGFITDGKIWRKYKFQLNINLLVNTCRDISVNNFRW